MATKSTQLRITCLSFVALAFIAFNALGQSLPSDVLANLNSYNVSWNSASTTGSTGSMPLGNGDITSNVWVESNGDLMLYIGKSDTWSEGTRLLKIGRVRIGLLPNPFIAGKAFKQELNLYSGEIKITAGDAGSQVNIKIWIDANNPVIHVEAAGEQNFAMSCKTEIMRPTAYTLPSGSDALAPSFRGVTDGPVKPSESADVVMSKEGRLEWYHRNSTSMFPSIMTNHNLGAIVSNFTDPYMNRTFGAVIKGAGMSKTDDVTLQSNAETANHSLSIYAYTAQTPTIQEWDNQLTSKINEIEAIPLATAYLNHEIWWDSFWNRSWIFITGDAAATSVTKSYLLQRYMMACMSRGKYPVKFNGGSLTFDYLGKNGDYRTWGPGYWNQNNRHLYWPLLASGDLDLIKPWFDCYMNMLNLQKTATTKLYNHGGAFFPETFNFFGLFIQDDWGWNNTGKNSNTQWIRYHYSGALEVLSQMLEYYDYTKDQAFVDNYIVPFSTEVIRFFDQHWARQDGKIKFYPANALETYWDCTNPADYIAGLRYTIPQICSLPGSSVTQQLKDEWNGCLNALPALPMDVDSSVVKPALLYGEAHNSENPECYSIFPYKIYGIGRDNIDVGISTFANRRVKGSTCWAPDPIQAPLVGMTDFAKSFVTNNSKSVDATVRFPAFWAPKNDYMPDFDNGGALMTGLQSMLIQSVDSKVYVLPAWPSTWNVDYKLQAYGNTSVRVVSQGSTITKLDVFPLQRLNDIVQPSWKQNQSLTFPELPVTKVGGADISPGAIASSVLLVTYTSSDTTIAKIVNNKIRAVGNGEAMITAIQSGNSKYNPSPAVKRKLVVSQFTSTRYEAEKFNGQSGIQTETCAEGGLNLAFVNDGDYTFYNNVNLTGATRIELRVAGNVDVGNTAGTIEIRVGSPTGTLLGSVTVPGTSGWQIWTTISCQLTGAQGKQTLYLVYKNNCVFNVNWFDVITNNTTEAKTINRQKSFGFILFPNPAGKDCQVGFFNPTNQSVEVTLKVNSISGKLIKSDKYVLETGNQKFRLNTGSLKPGIYLADCISDGYRETKKLMIK